MRYLVVLAVLLLAGCMATFTPTGACVDGRSVILATTGGNPTGLNQTFLTANFAGLEAGKFTAQQAAEFFDRVEALVKSGVTYIDTAAWLGAEIETINRYIGFAMIVGGTQVQAIGALGGAQLISDCDVQLITAHINNQRQLLGLYR